jgi:hypothetical protein
VLGASKVELLSLAQGRSAVDSVYYCYHGKMKSNQCIVDWEPFEEYTIDGATPLGVSFSTTFKLEPANDGTRLILLWGKARGAWTMCKLNDLLQKISSSRKGLNMVNLVPTKETANHVQTYKQDYPNNQFRASPNRLCSSGS